MNKKNTLLKNTLVYMLANFGSKVLVFILYPIYTYCLLPEELGRYDLIISGVDLLVPFASLCVYEGMFRWLLDDENDKNVVFSVCLLFEIICALICLGAGMVLHTFWGERYIIYISLMISLMIIERFMQYLHRGLKNNNVYAAGGIIYTFFLASFNIFFLRVLGMKIDGLCIGTILAVIVTNIYYLNRLVRKRVIVFKFDKKILTGILKYSFFLIPNNVNWWIMNMSDRYVIRYFLGEASNGIYSISCKLPAILNLITHFFTLAWQEETIANNDDKKYKGQVFEHYYLLLFSVSALLIPLSKYLLHLFVNEAYYEGWKYVPVLYVATVFNALAAFLGAEYLKKKKTRNIMWTSMLAAVVNLVVNLLLVRQIGMHAASISTLFSFGVFFFVRVIYARNWIEIQWRKLGCLIGLNILYIMGTMQNSVKIDIVLIVVAVVIVIMINRKLVHKLLKSVIRFLGGISGNKNVNY